MMLTDGTTLVMANDSFHYTESTVELDVVEVVEVVEVGDLLF